MPCGGLQLLQELQDGSPPAVRMAGGDLGTGMGGLMIVC